MHCAGATKDQAKLNSKISGLCNNITALLDRIKHLSSVCLNEVQHARLQDVENGNYPWIASSSTACAQSCLSAR